jgi:hypothetical protein
MNEFLNSVIGPDYTDYIEYKDKFKKLNEKLDVILYLCDNVSNNRIKNFIINKIESGDYYDYEDEELGISNIDENDIFEKIVSGEDYEKMLEYIEGNLKNIDKKNDEFIEEYRKFDANNETYKDPKYDLENQIKSIKDKLGIIVTKLGETKIENSKDDIKFNIILINKDSFLDYKVFKKLFKNLHIIEKSKRGNDKDLIDFKEKLKNIYNLTYEDISGKLEKYNSKVDKFLEELTSSPKTE